MATESFIGGMMLYTSDRTTRGWLPADGRQMSVSQNSVSQNNVLFAVIGARFGGGGRTTFGLPDMRKQSPEIEGMGWCIAVDGVFASS